MDFKTVPPIREAIPSEKVKIALKDLTSYILTQIDVEADDVALVGVQTRGVVIAERIAQQIKQLKGCDVPLGAIDITLYRDDVSTTGVQTVIGETRIDFDIDNKKIILIDDVLFTGRTIRAALDEIMDYGRPQRVFLVVLVDRGHRELPIAADFTALKITTKRTESVDLHLEETDGKDEILIYESPEYRS